MPKIILRENEQNIEGPLRKFKKAVEKAGTMPELRAREAYEKPTTERKRKKSAAVKRHHKRLRSLMLPKRSSSSSSNTNSSSNSSGR